ncbi:hypothetical protein [Paraburkholderia sp.]|uniref:hypothetical protein n=1 Tax=Paraburkholderia sp. TaxID=1926495 RepID=UPI00238AD691|nr:hypothetical protein [Paraburkholderia sp.]MDE1180191.1 hypothetical protein [Paraburkholderia sp.]
MSQRIPSRPAGSTCNKAGYKAAAFLSTNTHEIPWQTGGVHIKAVIRSGCSLRNSRWAQPRLFLLALFARFTSSVTKPTFLACAGLVSRAKFQANQAVETIVKTDKIAQCKPRFGRDAGTVETAGEWCGENRALIRTPEPSKRRANDVAKMDF